MLISSMCPTCVLAQISHEYANEMLRNSQGLPQATIITLYASLFTPVLPETVKTSHISVYKDFSAWSSSAMTLFLQYYSIMAVARYPISSYSQK